MAKQGPKRRVRPSITTTIDPGVHERLLALVERLPGASLSMVLDELLEAALPLYEDMADAMIGATGPDGMDETAAQEAIAAKIGLRILRAAGLPLPVQDTGAVSGEGGDVTT